MLEKLIAHHCGPALAGIKPSNIVSCQKSHISDIHNEIKRLNTQLNSKDIYIDILCERSRKVLVMVYRKNILENQLNNPDMNKFLTSFGYPVNAPLKEYIEFLKTRLSEEAFPHEIGAFLGYPLHDIHGFINHRDDGCLLIGEWKVYKDADKAEKLFSRYKACRNGILRRISHGCTLAQIFCAA